MRVLLAEDDRIIADGLVRALRKSNYAVDHVANGVDADAALIASRGRATSMSFFGVVLMPV